MVCVLCVRGVCGILVCSVCGVLVECVMCVVCVYGGCRGAWYRWCVWCVYVWVVCVWGWCGWVCGVCVCVPGWCLGVNVCGWCVCQGVVCVCVCGVCECGTYAENQTWAVKPHGCSNKCGPPRGCGTQGGARSWVAGSLLNKMREQPPKQTEQVHVGERVRDGGARSGRADISCGSLTLLCGLHKFHSKLLSMKLMKSQAVQQKGYQSAVFPGVSETSLYRRCAWSRAG